MFVGPIFTREAATTPRRPRLYLFRSLYVTVLMVLMCTAWLSLAGTQIINNVGDLAQFGSILFQILALIQLAMMVFLSSLFSVITVAREKDRKTLTLLLMTRMSNHELVLGKLFASLLNVFVMLAAALPLFMCLLLFGGVSIEQILRVFAVTLTSAIVVGSLGCMLAFWRENTFQTLSMTVLGLVFWIGVWEAIGLLDGGLLGVPFATWATSFSPLSAVWAAASPFGQTESVLGVIGNGVNMFLITALSGAALINVVTILRVRVWNPSREVQRVQREETQESIWGAQHDLEAEAVLKSNGADSRDQVAEVARASHVDARVKTSRRKSRRVWDNPILWRGVCTRAHGRKVILIRAAYFLLFAMAAVALHLVVRSAADPTRSVKLPPSAILTLFVLLSIVLVTALAVTSVTNERDGQALDLLLVSDLSSIVTALAVTSVTNERDGQALDLLLVSDLSSKEFVFGKLGGVF
ncbi:MAG: ABC transporter permease, partial [Planctomycetes bacterium]|nr:ABC transporter permease [Planctomycetota bacterium]